MQSWLQFFCISFFFYLICVYFFQHWAFGEEKQSFFLNSCDNNCRETWWNYLASIVDELNSIPIIYLHKWRDLTLRHRVGQVKRITMCGSFYEANSRRWWNPIRKGAHSSAKVNLCAVQRPLNFYQPRIVDARAHFTRLFAISVQKGSWKKNNENLLDS